MDKKNNIVKVGNKAYIEVELDGMGDGRSYRNPLTKVFQYEYALYRAVSDLFASVQCRSMCIESLKLYFSELSHSSDKAEGEKNELPAEEKKKKTQEDLIAAMAWLVARDVVGHITFPEMNICQAEVLVSTNEDGTHTFVFEDGIYGFSVRLNIPRKGTPKTIEVKDLFCGR